jgi:hypothetical protein
MLMSVCLSPLISFETAGFRERFYKHLVTGGYPNLLGLLDRGSIPDGCWEFFSKTALGPTQPPIQWVPGALSLGVKRPGREADHSPPSSAEVKE